MKTSSASEPQSAADLISNRIGDVGGWRGRTLEADRALIKAADRRSSKSGSG
jgi:hypothetical protein